MPKDAPSCACELDGTCTVTGLPLADVTATVRSLWNPYLKAHSSALQTALNARAKVCKRPRVDDADGDADGGKAKRGPNEGQDEDADAAGSEAGDSSADEDKSDSDDSDDSDSD